MSRLERVLAGLLRAAGGRVAGPRRDWAEAVLAETREIPTAKARVAWLAGGMWCLARQITVGTIARMVAFCAAATVVAVIGWPGGSDPVMAATRFKVVGTLLVLGAAPYIVGWWFGSVGPGHWPHVLRYGGYAALLAMTAANASTERVADTLPAYDAQDFSAWAMHVAYLLAIACYVCGLLVVTSAGSPVATSTLRPGVRLGAIAGLVLCAFTPLQMWWGPAGWISTGYRVSFWLVALVLPLVVGGVAARSARAVPADVRSPADFARAGCLAAACGSATAALVMAALMSLPIALFPHRVPLQTDMPAGGVCETCDPDSTIIPVGLRHEYLVDLTIGQAGGAAGPLLSAAPILGAGLGAFAGALLGGIAGSLPGVGYGYGGGGRGPQLPSWPRPDVRRRAWGIGSTGTGPTSGRTSGGAARSSRCPTG